MAPMMIRVGSEIEGTIDYTKPMPMVGEFAAWMEHTVYGAPDQDAVDHRAEGLAAGKPAAASLGLGDKLLQAIPGSSQISEVTYRIFSLGQGGDLQSAMAPGVGYKVPSDVQSQLEALAEQGVSAPALSAMASLSLENPQLASLFLDTFR